jgi:hypothetical protein
MGVGFGKGICYPAPFSLAIDLSKKILAMAIESGPLHRLPGRFIKSRISLYADDAVIFLAPTTQDVTISVSLLQNFGKVTGLMMNVSKSFVAPIRHDNIDLKVTLATFPCHFGPIPCEISWLASIPGSPKTCGFQPYLDTVVARLTPWIGKFLNHASCVALMK